MSEDPQQLYKDAMKAMEAGKPNRARQLLNQYLEIDEENVEAWVALSKVVESEDEKRICLTTILQLDPANSYARRELAKSEERIEQEKSSEEVAPGITRRMVRMATIGSTLFILVVFVVTLLIVSAINSSKSAERAELTRISSDATATVALLETSNAETATVQMQLAISQTAEAQLLITPSATFTRTPDPSFPTWTPTPTEAVAEYRVLELPPAAIPGIIYGWGGRDSTDSGYLNPFTIPANGSEPLSEIINEFSRAVTSNVPGNRVLFERYIRRLEDTTLAVLDPSAPETSLTGFPELFTSVDVLDIRNPSMSADGNRFVVDALIRGTNIREVFLLDITANTITQITNDSANYNTPALSLDGTQILASKQDPTNGTDLVLIDVETLEQRPMTNDGDALIESQPAWHQDNLQAVFKAHPQGQEGNSEIYLLRILPESSATSLLIATQFDETQPVFDPSSLFIAFASNRGAGVYNIYIFDMTTLETYQLTDFEFNHYPGGWSLS